MQQLVEQAVEAAPDDGGEDGAEEPAFLSLDLEIGEDEHGHRDRESRAARSARRSR